MTVQKLGEERSRSLLLRLVICVVIIALGIAGFMALKKMKKAPPQVVQMERPIKVEALTVVQEDIPVVINGHGELKSVRMLEVAAEVSGRIVSVHRDLEVGRTIPKGELLCAIDESDYRADYEMNRARLRILQRDKELAQSEFVRIQSLFTKSKVGTEAGVEAAEKTANTAADRLAQVEQAVIRAKNNLERCRLYAPYTSRIVSKNIEVGQYVAPGGVLFSLADDSLLELIVAIDSRDALKWLEFDGKTPETQEGGWFAAVKQVPVQLRWTEAPQTAIEGVLDRVGTFNTTTRSVELIVRLDAVKSKGIRPGFPLVSGMFCSVEIPGKMMEGVFALPRWAVSFDKNVYVIQDNRLVTTPVEVARIQGDRAYVSAGLQQGDTVITTRLSNPLEQSLVTVVDVGTGEKK